MQPHLSTADSRANFIDDIYVGLLIPYCLHADISQTNKPNRIGLGSYGRAEKKRGKVSPEILQCKKSRGQAVKNFTEEKRKGRKKWNKIRRRVKKGM